MFWIAIASTMLVLNGCGLQQQKFGRVRVPDNAAMTTLVRCALMENPATSALPIRVTTEQGVVLLSGTVDNAAERLTAEQITWTVKGVYNVENRVIVRDTESLTSNQR